MLWDRRTLAPVAPAIVWQDRRTSERCRELRESGRRDPAPRPHRARRRSLLLRDQARVAAARRRAPAPRRARASWPRARSRAGSSPGSPADESTSPITPTRRARCSTASPRATGTRSCFGCSACRAELLPAIVRSAGRRGRDRRRAPGTQPADRRAGRRPAGRALRTGLLSRRAGQEHLRHRRVPAGVHGRASAAHRGQGVLATAACGPGGEPAYALEGSVFIAGAAVQWLRDGLGLIRAAARDRGARPQRARHRRRPLRAGVRRVSARRTGSRRPAAPSPVSPGGPSRAHLVRAALEAMAFSSAELLEAMTARRRRSPCRRSAWTGARRPTTG